MAGFEKITVEKTRGIAAKKGLKPGRVIGSDMVHLTKGGNRFTIISWEEFAEVLEKRGLSVYEYGGFMKIMKAK